MTGVDAPLYPQGFGNDEFSIDRCVKNYNELGVPKEKLNVGCKSVFLSQFICT